jgi:hypothetical protein
VYRSARFLATAAARPARDARHLDRDAEQKGESHSTVLGFFRQFERYCVVADERDGIGVRTTVCGERVFLYRIQIAVERARERCGQRSRVPAPHPRRAAGVPLNPRFPKPLR